MANPKIKFKRSSVAGKKPTLDNIELGELALNTYDGKVFLRQDTSGVGIGTTVTVVNPWTENYGGTKITYNGDIEVTNVIAGIVTATSFVGLNVTGVSTFSSSASFGGDVLISDKIVHTGDTDTAIRFPASNTFTVETAGNERMQIDNSGRLLVGTSSGSVGQKNHGGTGWVGIFQVARNAVDATAQFTNWSDSAGLDNYGGSSIFISRCKSGVVGNQSGGGLSNNNHIGRINFNASDGSNFLTAASIDVQVDGVSGTNDMPGRLLFFTTADGSTMPTERLRIGSAGQIGLGGANYGTSGQVLTSNGSSSAPTWQDAGGSSSSVWETDAIGINTTKSVGIGTTAKDGYSLYVQGDARITGTLTAGSLVKSGGTSSQFLKADGSVDSSVYITSADGGNADQLDGEEGTYYLNYNNFSNTPTIPTNNNELTNGAGYITSADGGNADQLDGLDSTQFLRSDANDSFTGTITNSGTFVSFHDSNTPSTNIRLGRSTDQYYTIHGGSIGNFLTSISTSGNPKSNLKFAYSVDGGSSLASEFTLNGSSGTIWHSGNDGSGSGLDADRLDGYNSSVSATASTVVVRDGSGHITANYLQGTWLKATHGGDAVSSVSYFPGVSSDGWYYHLNQGNMQTALNVPTRTGGNATGTWGINITGDANTLDGYDSSVSATGSTVAVRDSDGDLNVRYLISNYCNMSHSTGTRSSDTIFYSSTDDYIRKTNATGMRSALNVPTRTGGDASGTWGISITGSSASVSINYNNDSNSTYQMLWGSSNSVYGTGGIYCNPSSDTVYATNFVASGDINSSSDIRLKTNIKTLTNSLDRVLQMRGVEYDRIDLEGKHQIGVIAQEIEEVAPELVSSDDDGMKSVSYGNITAILIEAMKEQQEQIEQLNQEIKELKGET